MKTIHTKEYKSLIDWLTSKRQLAGMSQQQLADLLEKPQSYVSKYENGDRRLDFLEVLDICFVIKADPTSLINSYMERKN
jgi:transcriptional regulator with XRE-family HTH domain